MGSKHRHRRRKRLSSEEAARRQRLREQRAETKRRKKRFLAVKILLGILAGVLVLGFSLYLGISGHEHAMYRYDTVLILIAAVLTDRSGFRELLFMRYPEHFPFADFLKRHISGRRFWMELARTIFYAAICAIALWERLYPFCAPVVVGTIVIGYGYLITDQNDLYTFDKTSAVSDTALYLIFAGLFGIAFFSRQQGQVPSLPVLIGSLLITAAYLLFAKSDKKIPRALELYILSGPDLLTVILILQSLYP